MRDLAGLLFKAVEPQGFAQADFRGELSVAGEVVVDLVRFEVGCSSSQVTNVQANVETLRLDRIFMLRYLVPAQPFRCSPVVRLSVPRLADYGTLICLGDSWVRHWRLERICSVS